MDQTITAKIEEILTRAKLSPEMLNIIHDSFQVDLRKEEPYRWAHLTLMSCECANGAAADALPGAVAMEFFALAADIYDDVQDQDNDELPWRKIANANAVNLATCLLTLSYEALTDIADPKLFRAVSMALNRTGTRAIDAQFVEFLYDSNEKITLDEYFDLIKRKSGSLTTCACEIGALISGASAQAVRQFAQLGEHWGIMCQIKNDLNDFLDFERKRDFMNNRKTLPYVYLLSVLTGESAAQFMELTRSARREGRQFKQEGREALRKMAAEEGAGHYCKVMYEMFRQEAEKVLNDIAVPEERKGKLRRMIGFAPADKVNETAQA
ncbi:MAG: polyprenyl synthetase family protein [Peptococcaceae bacterium]|jgi:competence protein ComQ|nr:polyprenyl synthetase family protein [Peptococcaceae bacterium]